VFLDVVHHDSAGVGVAAIVAIAGGIFACYKTKSCCFKKPPVDNFVAVSVPVATPVATPVAMPVATPVV